MITKAEIHRIKTQIKPNKTANFLWTKTKAALLNAASVVKEYKYPKNQEIEAWISNENWKRIEICKQLKFEVLLRTTTGIH